MLLNLTTKHLFGNFREVIAQLPPTCCRLITKVTETAIREFLYADDCALSACLESTVQQQMNKFSIACGHFILIISTKKTKEM